jgi:hypothetical protein
MDAADILGAAPRTEFRARIRHSHAAQDVAGNKLTGLKKEVFDLTGKDVGANKPETPVQAFGKKHTQLKRKVHWEFTGFSNSARTDGLHLRHWQVLDKRLLHPAAAATCGIDPRLATQLTMWYMRIVAEKGNQVGGLPVCALQQEGAAAQLQRRRVRAAVAIGAVDTQADGTPRESEREGERARARERERESERARARENAAPGPLQVQSH